MRKTERVGKFTNHEKLHKIERMERCKDRILDFNERYILRFLPYTFVLSFLYTLSLLVKCLMNIAGLKLIINEKYIWFMAFIATTTLIFCCLSLAALPLLDKIISLLQKKVLLKGLDLLITDIPSDRIDEIKGACEAIGYDCKDLKIVDSECNYIKIHKKN